MTEEAGDRRRDGGGNTIPRRSEGKVGRGRRDEENATIEASTTYAMDCSASLSAWIRIRIRYECGGWEAEPQSNDW